MTKSKKNGKLVGHSIKLQKLKVSLKLTGRQRQALIGLLLGDGHLLKQSRSNNISFIFSQSEKHKSYVFHVYDIFAPLCLSPPKLVRRKKGYLQYRFSTLSLPSLWFYHRLFYRGKKKIIPKDLPNFLTNIGLAYWYMDDGSLKSKESKGLILNTHSFTKEECDFLCECLRKKFALSCWPRHQFHGKSYYQIYISGYSFEKMEQIVLPFLFSDMRYKWPLPRKKRKNLDAN